jgi:uncharacterized membrane protein (DUF485 family)
MIGNKNKMEETHDNRPGNNIEAIVKSEVYLDLIKRKKRFLFRVILFFIGFYFALPLSIILFPKVMSIRVFHHLTVAWIFALLQFAMIWGLGAVYFLKAKQFDRLAEKLASWGKNP